MKPPIDINNFQVSDLNEQIKNGKGKIVAFNDIERLFPDGVCAHGISIFGSAFCNPCENTLDVDKVTL